MSELLDHESSTANLLFADLFLLSRDNTGKGCPIVEASTNKNHTPPLDLTMIKWTVTESVHSFMLAPHLRLVATNVFTKKSM